MPFVNVKMVAGYADDQKNSGSILNPASAIWGRSAKTIRSVPSMWKCSRHFLEWKEKKIGNYLLLTLWV